MASTEPPPLFLNSIVVKGEEFVPPGSGRLAVIIEVVQRGLFRVLQCLSCKLICCVCCSDTSSDDEE